MKKATTSWFVVWMFLLVALSGQQSESLDQKKLLSLFLTIESSDASNKSIEAATNKIESMGKVVLPVLEQRFSQTGQPRYLYLIQKLKKKPVVWNKNTYLKSKFLQAQQEKSKGNWQKAKKIAQAILVLEPLFQPSEIYEFIRQCKDLENTSKILTGKILQEKDFWTEGEKYNIRFQIQNLRQEEVIFPGKNKIGIVMNISLREHLPSGKYQEEKFTKIFSWKKKFRIQSNKALEIEVPIPLPKSKNLSYREIHIEGYITRLVVWYQKRPHHCKIIFPSQTIPIVPKKYQRVVANPVQNFRWALELGYAQHLFFSSFFISNRKEKSQMITEMIASLDNPKLQVVILGILQDWTGKNFSSKILWQNWWQARRIFWEENSNE